MVAVAHIPIVSRFVFSTNLYLDCSEENLTLNKKLKQNPIDEYLFETFQMSGNNTKKQTIYFGRVWKHGKSLVF